MKGYYIKRLDGMYARAGLRWSKSPKIWPEMGHVKNALYAAVWCNYGGRDPDGGYFRINDEIWNLSKLYNIEDDTEVSPNIKEILTNYINDQMNKSGGYRKHYKVFIGDQYIKWP